MNQYWDVAGEKILVMGRENGGIEEIWAHPYMALRDYETILIRIFQEPLILGSFVESFQRPLEASSGKIHRGTKLVFGITLIRGETICSCRTIGYRIIRFEGRLSTERTVSGLDQ